MDNHEQDNIDAKWKALEIENLIFDFAFKRGAEEVGISMPEDPMDLVKADDIQSIEAVICGLLYERYIRCYIPFALQIHRDAPGLIETILNMPEEAREILEEELKKDSKEYTAYILGEYGVFLDDEI